MYNGIYPVKINRYTPPAKKNLIQEQPQDLGQSNPQITEENHQGQSHVYENTGAIDYNAGKVNISQILVDFKNTLNAIGAPQEINEEVESYLALVEKQSQKEEPSRQIIKSNLRNAAQILDVYIAQTLNKPSKVVTNWIDAIFLQQVEYKAEGTTSIALKTQENTQTQTEEQATSEEIVKKPPKSSPQTKQLVSTFKEAEALATQGKYFESIEAYKNALAQAEELNAKNAQVQILTAIADSHDKTNNIIGALNNYNRAAAIAQETGNNTAQAKLHYNMATLYDEVGKFDAAMNHYFAALALDGQAENISGQCLSLNSIGNMYAFKFENKNALDYYKLAFSLAKEAKDTEAMGIILSNTAGVFRKEGQDRKALKYYREAIRCDLKTGNLAGCLVSYENSAEIMTDLGQVQKAFNLYQKTINTAQKLGNEEKLAQILTKIKTSAQA